ncbi:MAG: VOC family protein [Bacteroidota bacterium]
MKIQHIALWTYQLEALKDFYVTFFSGHVDAHYFNPEKQFESYFLSFESGSRLELMTMPDIPQSKDDAHAQFTGIIHIAFDAGSPQAVDNLTEKIGQAGWPVIGKPRTTGDGYYESVILDPDNNRIEIACKPDA